MGRSKLQRGLALALTAGLVLTSMPVTAKAAVKSAYTIGVGKRVTGSVSARITKVSVKNKKVATVIKTARKNFRIKGVNPGKTVVTVTYGSKKTKKINVTVGATAIQKKTFQTNWKVGQSTAVSVSAKSGTGDTLSWVSSDDAVVSVSKGTSKVSSAEVASNQLTAHNTGKATITIKSKNTGKKLQVPVTVQMAANPTSVPITTIAVSSTVQPQNTPQATVAASVMPTQTAEILPTGPAVTVQTALPSATDTPVPQDTPGIPQSTTAPSITATTGAISVSTNIYGATLSIKAASGEAVSAIQLLEDQNTFVFPALPNGEYTVEAQKDGYQSDSRKVLVNGDTVQVSLTLQKQEVLTVQAVHTTSLTRLQVDASHALEKVDKHCFSIDDMIIYSATLSNDKSSVILTTSKMTGGRSYTLHVSEQLAAAGLQGMASDHSFVAKEVDYGLKLRVEDEQTELLADPSVSAQIYASVYDEDGYIVKDLAGVEITYKTTAGSFAQSSLLTNADTIVNTFTSQEAADRVDAYITATITTAANENLINLTASRTIVLNPSGDTGETGIYLNDVSIEAADRMILYFNKEVNVTDYTQNCANLNDIYGYDADKLQILVQDAGSNHTLTHIAEGSLGNRTIYALAPVEGNKKALCAYLSLNGNSSPLTNHARVVVKVTDKTTRYDLTSTKYTTVNDVSNPYITKVENVSLRTLRITFSEAVQSANNAFGTTNADAIYRWSIDDVLLSDNKYGYGSTYMSTMSVGDFNRKTGEDHRNEVTLTLGKNVSGGQLYFTQGIHRLACQNIGDWANVTSTKTNLCKGQQVTFSVSDDQKDLSATVEVYSPEQYCVTFDRAVDVNIIKRTLTLQEFYGQKWMDTSKNTITITPILAKDTDAETDTYMVEVDADWTETLRTSTSYKNYYNTDFRLHIDAGEIYNLENGVLNKEINLPLDDAKMKTLDTDSPTIEKVQQYGSLIYVTMSEPVQIPGITEETPTENQRSTGISVPVVTFISPDNKQTIPGTIVGMTDAYDMTFSVVPSAQLLAGTWKLSIASISDDIGNTAETLSIDEFPVNTTIEAEAGFQVLWVLAVPRGATNPLLPDAAPSNKDKIYIKFSERFKTYGNATNAAATTNYSINNATLPNATTITACLDGYNTTANVQNNYTDLIQLEVKAGTLTEDSNTLTISSTIESIYGDRLANSGVKVLEKRTTTVNDYYFAYNYKTVTASETNTVRKLVQYIRDVEYTTVNYARMTDSEQKQIAANTSLTIAKAGTFNLTSDYVAGGGGVESRNTFKELNISTKETGKILIKNAIFTTVDIDAPNAEVVFDNVTVAKMHVTDVLDGTLHLKNRTICSEMEITDCSNGGRIEADDTSSVPLVTVNTVGSVTLGLRESSSVIIEKPAKVTFTNKVNELTLMRTAVGAQIINGMGAGTDIYTTLTDQTSSNDLATAIANVDAAFSNLETGLNTSNIKEFTVTMPSSVRMAVSVPEGVTGFTFSGNKLTYSAEDNQKFSITVTATCTLNNTIYTTSKTYKLECSATDIVVATQAS